MPGQAPYTAMRTGTGKVILGHNHIFTDTAAQVVMTHIEAILGHDIGIIATTQGVALNAQVPHTGDIAIDCGMTHHIAPLQIFCTQKLLIIPLQRLKSLMFISILQILKMRFTLVTLALQQITKQTTSKEEHQSQNRRSTHGLLQFWWPFQQLRRGDRSFKLNEPSSSSDSHEQGELTTLEPVTVVLIMDCPTITFHTGKHYKAPIDSGATISLIRYSTYQLIDDRFKNSCSTNHHYINHSRQITNDGIGNDSTSSQDSWFQVHT